MNSATFLPVAVRVIVYVLSAFAGMIPAAWAGWVSYDAAAGVVTVSVEGLAVALAMGLAGSFGVLAKWGKW